MSLHITGITYVEGPRTEGSEPPVWFMPAVTLSDGTVAEAMGAPACATPAEALMEAERIKWVGSGPEWS
jgi:hypothetical protein